MTLDDPVMGEEIFGPILPVLTYTDLDAALARACCAFYADVIRRWTPEDLVYPEA